MKRVGKPVFFIVALLILFLTATSIFGIHVQNGDNTVTYIKGTSDIRWGIDINGGSGKLQGTFLGILIIGILRNGLNLMGLSVIYQSIILGVLLLVAVAKRKG